MKRFSFALTFAFTFAFAFAFAKTARADGCYICGSGSQPQCKDYCRYTGKDTFPARKECEKKGCKIAGTASCPTAVNYKVCEAPVVRPIEIAWCQ